MPDTSDRSENNEPQSEPESDAGANPSSSAAPGQLAPWSSTDRKRLLTWAAVAFVVPLPFLFALHFGLSTGGGSMSVSRELPAKALTAFSVLLATWIVSRIEKRPLGDYGAAPRRALGIGFWEGCIWGFAALSAILLVLYATGHFQIDAVALRGGALLRYGLAWAAVFLAVGLNEEFTFRGYLLFVFARRARFWRAALVLSALFGAAHLPNHGENTIGILQVVEFGLLMCLTLRRTGSLWFAVGFHAAWDWAETFFYGTPDSGLLGTGRFLGTSFHGPSWLTGGSAGPEGSVITLLVLLLCALLVHFRFPKAVYPDRPV